MLYMSVNNCLFALVASSLSFMESCDFELENVCGMIQSSEDSADWQRVSQVPEGPESDHSNMGRCKGNRSEILPDFTLSGSSLFLCCEILGFEFLFLLELLMIAHSCCSGIGSVPYKDVVNFFAFYCPSLLFFPMSQRWALWSLYP